MYNDFTDIDKRIKKTETLIQELRDVEKFYNNLPDTKDGGNIFISDSELESLFKSPHNKDFIIQLKTDIHNKTGAHIIKLKHEIVKVWYDLGKQIDNLKELK